MLSASAPFISDQMAASDPSTCDALAGSLPSWDR